jgi:CRP-like cAMP-binding protein
MLADALARHPAFSGLSRDDLAEVASRCEHQRLPTGGVLFEEGAASAHLYIVLRGRIRVSCRASSGVQVVVGGARGGDVVGEMGVLDDSPRSATLTAEEPVEVLKMRGEVLTELVDGAHPAAAALLRVVRRQLVERVREIDERVDAVFEMFHAGAE